MTAPTWTVATLKAAIDELADTGEISCTIREGGQDVLEVTLAAAGDLVLFVVPGETQILTTAVLWPRSAQENPQEFEAMMLRSHKMLLPLSAISIDQIEGEEYYELFGSISQGAHFDALLTEFETIGANALELARDLGPNSADESQTKDGQTQ